MRNGREPTVSSRRRGATVLVFTCAASAGAHAGLVPAHLNGEPRLGAAFVAAVVLLVAAATSVAARPADRRITSAAGLLLAGLILAYVVSRTTGIPVLDPEPEAVDAVGIATNVVEALGVVVALGLTHPLGRHGRLAHLKEVPP
jgi:FtsH-binding integral membrane protein